MTKETQAIEPPACPACGKPLENPEIAYTEISRNYATGRWDREAGGYEWDYGSSWEGGSTFEGFGHSTVVLTCLECDDAVDLPLVPSASGPPSWVEYYAPQATDDPIHEVVVRFYVRRPSQVAAEQHVNSALCGNSDAYVERWEVE